MSLRNNRLIFLNHLYLIAFGLILIELYLKNSLVPTSIQIPFKLMYIIGGLLLFYKIILDNYTLNEYMCIITLIILSLIITFVSKDDIILIDVLLVVGAKKVNFIRIMRVFFYIGLIMTSIFILFSLIRLLPIVDASGVGQLSVRYSLGFNYHVKLSESILVLSVVYSLIHFINIRWRRIFIYLFLSIFIFIVPNTKMDFYGMIILIFIVLIKKIRPAILKKFPMNLSWLSLLIMSGLSIGLALSYNNLISNSNNFNKLEQYSEGRFFVSNYWLTTLRPSLFGHDMSKFLPFIGPNNVLIHNYIDQSIIRMIVMYGILIFIIYLFVYSYKMFTIYKKGMNFYVLLFLVIVFRGFFDINLLNIYGDPFLVIIMADLTPVKRLLNKNNSINLN